jgi:hypothetical protein
MISDLSYEGIQPAVRIAFLKYINVFANVLLLAARLTLLPQ